MKKKLLYSLILSMITLTSFSQSVKITTMVEGDCPTGSLAPRVIELYVEGTVDVTDLKIQFQFASATNWVTNNNIGVGEYTDTYLYVVNDIDAFDDNFPGVRTPQNTTIGTVLSSVEGGDKVRLVDSSNSNQVIDIYGFDGQNGENASWNFSNSYVKRNSGSGPNSTFVESEWAITPKNTLLFAGICWDEDPLDTTVALQNYALSIDDDLEIANMSLKYYPNPAKRTIKVTGLETSQNFVMYNILGKEVLRGILENNKLIDINELSKGVYLLKTENGKTLKIIKD
ncbi:T9SS type A sorting domain-containing protein [Winogradskyella litoriviva]|uniref:T9SS type A sorting domain-containing protein n=1 Tax=Winogradskyella litoriviva TaxID=1220182 RepID=A0ABX2E213_9FLAO|nr:T9SS type A sorting domain-containing protein [Winogradskyella litoriviva]NRD22529.1 T9SS type A sorting domain-containing protein [Winogradskyella litoriviva]